MLSLFGVACVLSASAGATVWIDARHLNEDIKYLGNATFNTAVPSAQGSVDIAQEGDYSVWVWAPGGTKHQVALSTQRFLVEQPENKKAPGRYEWSNAGTLHLPAGPAHVAFFSRPLDASGGLGFPRIAACVLSTHPELKPEKLLGDRLVFDQPRAAGDRRAEKAKHTNTVFTMPEFTSTEVWEAYAAELRERALLSSGLWPLPEKTPLNAEITDTIDRGEYSVSKVRFEAYPGFLVTGNLYKPAGEGPFPAVVNPHGHWEKGRLENSDKCSVPGRAITLAKLGMVAFTYDMIGYNDSLQFPHNWGGEKEKLWGIHPFAMQLWSSIRAVDFVEGLPYVDKEKIGATGASGGGTQTFALFAVEPRIKVAAPVNMISSTMQGGCLCENAPILRLSNSNMEIGALMAPRPLLMVSATGDWTRETPHVEYPAIRSIYRLYGAEDHVMNVPVDEDHNYNQQSREAMYRFFAKWLAGKEGFENYSEPVFQVEPDAALRLFKDKPDVAQWPDKDALIQQILQQRRDKNAAQTQAFLAAGGTQFEDEYRKALRLVLGIVQPAANALQPERVSKEERDTYMVERWLLSRKDVDDAVPALYYRPKDATPQNAVLVVHGQGKAALADAENGGPGPLIQGLLAQGKAILAIDAFLIGDHHSPLKTTERYREGGFMDTFQPTDTGERIQDVLTALAWLRSRRDLSGTIDLVGLDQGGLWALFAAALDDNLRNVLVDMNHFDAGNDEAWVGQYYVPCLRAIGDMETALALLGIDGGAAAPGERLTVFNAAALKSPVESAAVSISPDALDTGALLKVLG